jgi:hypothetical protein
MITVCDSGFGTILQSTAVNVSLSGLHPQKFDALRVKVETELMALGRGAIFAVKIRNANSMYLYANRLA